MTAAGPGVALPGRTVSPAGNGFQSAVLQPTVLLRTAAAVHGSAPASVLIPCPPSFCKLTYFANFRPNFALQYWLLADCRGLPCCSYHLRSGLQSRARRPPAPHHRRNVKSLQRVSCNCCLLQSFAVATQFRPAAAARRRTAPPLCSNTAEFLALRHTLHTLLHTVPPIR